MEQARSLSPLLGQQQRAMPPLYADLSVGSALEFEVGEEEASRGQRVPRVQFVRACANSRGPRHRTRSSMTRAPWR
jgi:hypothetical protein